MGKEEAGMLMSKKMVLLLWVYVLNLLALLLSASADLKPGIFLGSNKAGEQSISQVAFSKPDPLLPALPDLSSCYTLGKKLIDKTSSTKKRLAEKSPCCPALTKLVASEGPTVTAVHLSDTFIEHKSPLSKPQPDVLTTHRFLEAIKICNLPNRTDVIIPIARHLLDPKFPAACSSVVFFSPPKNSSFPTKCCSDLKALNTDLLSTILHKDESSKKSSQFAKAKSILTNFVKSKKDDPEKISKAMKVIAADPNITRRQLQLLTKAAEIQRACYNTVRVKP